MSKTTIARNARAGITTILAGEAARVMSPNGTPSNPVVTPAPAGAPDKAKALATLTSTLRAFCGAAQSFGDALRTAIEAGATRKELTDAFTNAGVKRGTLNQALARGMANGQWLHLRMRVRSDSDDKAIQAMTLWTEEYLNDTPAKRSAGKGKDDDDGGEGEGDGDEGETGAATNEGVKMTPTEVGTAWLRDLDPVSFIEALKNAKGSEKKAKAWLGKVAKALGA